MVINPKEVTTHQFHTLLLGAVAPRPIAFASTIDKNGNVNLSPFSFFNAFGSNPPTLIFSPARRVRDNTTKHSLENVLEVDEVVINVVSYDMVEQVSLASTEYEKGVNEFVKAGFTEEPSLMVRPPRVNESPVAFECKVKQVIHLGKEGGAGNLIICEILLMHIKNEILDKDKNQIDPQKIDLVARMGADWYCRASGAALFEIPKPIATKGIGFDNIPLNIRESKILTGNNLGRLGNVEKLPTQKEIEAYKKEETIHKILTDKNIFENKNVLKSALHSYAKQLLEKGKVLEAWKVLLIGEL